MKASRPPSSFKPAQSRGMSAMLRRLTAQRMSPPLAAGVLTATAMFTGASIAQAASASYTGAADNVFDNGGNWSTGTAPGDTTGVTTNNDVATFALTTAPATGAIITLSAQRNLGGITFGGTSGTAATFTIGSTAGPGLLLSSGGMILANGFSGSQNVNAPLVLQNASGGGSGTYTFETDTPGGSRILTIGGTVTGAATAGNTTTLTLQGSSTTINTINGVISDGSGGGNLAVVKNGTGTWQLNNTAETFTGGVTVNAGTLRVNAGGNTTSLLGSGLVTLSGGTLTLGSTTAATFNNALTVTTGTTSSLVVRTNDTFNPTSMTGTGTLILNNSNSAGTVITSSSFQGFGGTVDVEANGANGTTLRLASGFDTTSLQNATLNLGTNTFLTQNANTNSTITTQIGALSGGGTIGGTATGSGGGTFVYSVGNNSSTTFSGAIINGNTKSGLTKTGTGTLTLSGANTYTGGTNINSGNLNLGSAETAGTSGPLGASGTISFGGGTLQYSAANQFDYSSRFNTAANQAYSVDTNGQNVTFATALTSAGGSLTKTGAGTLTLTNTGSTFTGDININAGTLTSTTVGNAGGTGATSAFGNTSVARNINVNNGGTLLFSGGDQLIGNGTTPAATLVINAGGTVTNNGASFNTLGPVTLNGGTLTGTGGSGNTQFQMYQLRGPVTVGGTTASTISGGGNATSGYHLNGAITFNVADATGDAASDLNASATFIDGVGGSPVAGGIIKAGVGTMTLSGANTYTGGTTVDAGTLVAANSSALGTAGVAVGDNAGGPNATLRFLNADNASTIVDNNNGIVDFNTTGANNFSGIVSGAGAVTKTGTGTVTVNVAGGINNTTGTTTVSGGTLILNNTSATTDAALTSSSVTVTGSGSVLQLAANNQIGNASNVALSGGTFALGGAQEGTSQADTGLGTLTLTNGTTSVFDFSAPTLVSGNKTSAVSFAAYDFSQTGTLNITNWQGDTTNGGGLDQFYFGTTYQPSQLANIYFVNPNGAAGTQYQAMQLASGEIVPNEIAPTPEPGSIVPIVIGMAGLGVLIARRRRKTAAENCQNELAEAV